MSTHTTSPIRSGAADRSADDAPPRDLRRFWRVVAAIMLPLGPLLVTVARATMPYWTSDDPTTVVELSLADPGALQLGSWLGLLAVPALLAGVITLGYLARRSAPVLATIGTMLSVAAFVAIGGNDAGDAVVLSGGQIGLDAATLERLTTSMFNQPAAGAGMGMFVIGHIVGLLLLGIALWRARVVPRWVAIAVAASQPVHLVAAVIVPSRMLDVVLGWGLTTIGFTAVAVRVLWMRDDEWDAAPQSMAR